MLQRVRQLISRKATLVVVVAALVLVAGLSWGAVVVVGDGETEAAPASTTRRLSATSTSRIPRSTLPRSTTTTIAAIDDASTTTTIQAVRSTSTPTTVPPAVTETTTTSPATTTSTTPPPGPIWEITSTQPEPDQIDSPSLTVPENWVIEWEYKWCPFDLDQGIYADSFMIFSTLIPGGSTGNQGMFSGEGPGGSGDPYGRTDHYTGAGTGSFTVMSPCWYHITVRAE